MSERDARLRELLEFYSDGGCESLAKQALAILNGAEPDSSNAAPEAETAWLIELGQLCVGFCEFKLKWVTFTDKDALRFSRERDARNFQQAFSNGFGLSGTKITEHLWASAAPAKQTPAAPEGEK